MGYDAVYRAVKVEAWFLSWAGDSPVGNPGCVGVDGFHDDLMEVAANLPAKTLRCS
jgi:hypothetical protein